MPKKSALIKCLLFGFVIQASGIVSTASAVDRTVPGGYSNIQAAINAAVSGVDDVVVDDGTWSGTGNYDIDTLGKAIEVRSANGSDNCIIDCNYLGRGFICQTDETCGSGALYGELYGRWNEQRGNGRPRRMDGACL